MGQRWFTIAVCLVAHKIKMALTVDLGPNGSADVKHPSERVLIIACGALAKEITALKHLNNWDQLDIQCIDSKLHFRPALIPGKLREQIERYRNEYKKIFIGYADCGTAGEIDQIVKEEGISRLPGADCFASFAGLERFAKLAEEEPGTFYLTDFLPRHFDSMVIGMLGLDKHPELRDAYFGNYKRLVYLSQIRDKELMKAAKAAAIRLDLSFTHIHSGYGELEPFMAAELIPMVPMDSGDDQENSNLLA